MADRPTAAVWWLGVALLGSATSGCSLFVDIPDAPPDGVRRRLLQVPALPDEWYPLMVRLTDSRIDYRLVDDPLLDLDIRDSGGSSLDFEVERWNPAGQSELWVHAPGGETELELRYGAGVRGSAPASAQVWSDYALVWHLGEDVPTFSDSTASKNDGVAMLTGGLDPEVEGIVGNAVEFDQGLIAIQGPDAAALRPNPPFLLTVEAWVTIAATPADYATIAGRVGMTASTDPAQHCYRVGRTGPGTAFAAQMSTGTNLNTAPSSFDGDGAEPSTWHYLALTYDGDPQDLFIYVDDQPRVRNQTAGQFNNNSFPFLVGCGEPCDATTRHRGRIDELRVSFLPRSQAYIATVYQNLTDPDFIDFGDEERVDLADL